MKKLYILWVAMFLVNEAIGQPVQPCVPCLYQGIEFTSQTQIDNFQTNYPNCTSIHGNVSIMGNSITNLNGLSVLTSISGELFIYHNPALTSLAGLNGLTSIWGILTIIGNNALTSLSGLDNISAGSVSNLFICGNSSLSTCDVQSICDFLSSPNGSINIYGNAPGCNNPPEVATACGISLMCLPHGNYYFSTQADIDNYQTDYPNCTQLEGNIKIQGGSQIANLNGLGILKSVGGTLFIINQSILTNLTGLNSLTTIGDAFYILNNTALTGFTGMDSLSSIGGYFLIQLNPALTSLTGLKVLKSIGDELYIDENSALTSLTGLDSLTTIGGALGVYDQPALTTLIALNSLTSVGTSIDIIGNNSLTSLSGLDNINPGTIDFLSIYSNSSLSTCSVQSVCSYLLNPSNPFNIHSNAWGCNDEYQVEARCATIGLESKCNEQSLTIYPNPASDILIIETTISGDLTILDINGRQLQKHEIVDPSTKINICKLSNGIYILKLVGAKGVQVKKMFKV